MGIVDLNAASGGNSKLKQLLDTLLHRTDQTQTALGIVPTGICPTCRFEVLGQDGDTVITITNPDQAIGITIKQNQSRGSIPVGATVTHQLRSSSNPYFDADGSVIYYGPDSKIRWDVSEHPNEARYWQLRSSLDGGKTWNKWKDYIDSLSGSLLPVWSGQVRSTRQMPNCVLNVANFATVDSTFDGAFATIRVYGQGGPGTGWLRQVGSTVEGWSIDKNGNVIPFPSANLYGYEPGTFYTVYYDKQSGVYRVFTKHESSQGLADQYRYAGELTTVSSQVSIAQVVAVISNGSVVQINVTAGGSGYTSAPQVVIEGGTGSGAAAIATVSGGHITAIDVTNGGSGFTSSPTVTITGGGGQNATAVAVLKGTTVSSIALTAAGSGYLNPPTVAIVGGGGIGAQAAAVIENGKVTSITLLNGGTGYTSPPTITVGSGNGTGAMPKPLTTMQILFIGAGNPGYPATIAMQATGMGYTDPPPALMLNVPEDVLQFEMHTFVQDGAVTSVVIDKTTKGPNWTASAINSDMRIEIVSGGYGTGATADSALAPTGVDSIEVTNEGANYTSAPTIAVGSQGHGAEAVASIADGSVVSVQVTNGGSGYVTPPTVTLVGGIGGSTSTGQPHSSSVVGGVYTMSG